MAVLLVLIAWLHLGTLVLTAMFGYFAMHLFSFGRSKTLGVVVYLFAVVAIATGLFFFSKRAYKTLPEIANKTIPAVVQFAQRVGITGFVDEGRSFPTVDAAVRAADTLVAKE